MSFAAAIWLWSGLALAVPIGIHLLGRGRGARLPWPSLLLLREAALASGARFKPSRPWLLALRCAFLAAVTLALADPTLARRAPPADVWLVEAGVTMPPAGAAYGRGAVRRYLAPGLPTIPELPAKGSATPLTQPAVPDLWSLLAEADTLYPAGTTFHVLARPRLRALVGSRPRLAHSVQWESPAAIERVSAPAAKASGALLTEPRGKSLRLRVAASPERAGDAAVLRDGLTRAAADLGWRVDETPAAASEPRSADAVVSASGRSQAGAEGASDTATAKPPANRGADADATPELFASLGTEAPASWMTDVQRGAALFRDAGSAGDANRAGGRAGQSPTASLGGSQSGAANADAGNRGDGLVACASLVAPTCCGLFERALCAAEPAGEARWKDGAGRTVLAQTPYGHGVVLRYAGRLSSAGGSWNRGAFTALLREVPGIAAGRDEATAATETTVRQALPQRGGAAAPSTVTDSLAALFWLLAACLFAAERWLAARTPADRKRAA